MKIQSIIQNEAKFQNETINLIASENYPSAAVKRALSSGLMSKYAEGYPGERFYAGCQNYDEIEQHAIDLARKLFCAEHANVQPHSGTCANLAVYLACLRPGDKILAPSIRSGGHLSHGSRANLSGQIYDVHFYEVDPETGLFDYDQIGKQAKKIKPKLIIAGYSSYPREIDWSRFSQIAASSGAYLLADIAHTAGLIAAGVLASPVKYVHFVTFTTQKTLRGPRGGVILCRKAWAKKVDRAVFPGIQSGPHMNTIAAKAVCIEEALRPEFSQYAQKVVANARLLASELNKHGFNVLTGGTDNHLLIIDLRRRKITGQEAEKLLEKAGILVNRQLIPNDSKGALVCSGIRIGTPAVTSRGMEEAEMLKIAAWVSQVLKSRGKNLTKIYSSVKNLAKKFPIVVK